MTPQKVHHLSVQAAEAMEVLQGEVDSSRQKLLEFERNAAVMSVLMLWLLESVEAKEMAGGIDRAELKETEVVINEKELLLSQLRNAQETDRSLLRECEGKVSQLLENLEEAKKLRERVAADLGSETARLQSALEALEAEKKELAELKEKVESAASETSFAANALKEELALARSQLKEVEDEAAEAATAHESLAIVKEEWEAEKTGLQSDVLSLENKKSNLEAEIEVLMFELQQISRTSAGKEEELSESRKEIGVLQTELQTKQALLQEVEAKLLETVEASEQLIKEKDEKIAALKEESERMSCMSIKEDKEAVEMRRKLESLQEEIRAKERTLEELERQLLESVHASRTLGKEKDEEISELKAEINRLSCMYSENSRELSWLREELQAVQSELETKESLLQELQTYAGQAWTSKL